jgi:signal transduction histidine kinase
VALPRDLGERCYWETEERAMATVLMVDDREINRSLARSLLGYAGHTVLEACDGSEALCLARSMHPDLVVTDVLMPVMDGYELVRELRADPCTTGIPVVFYTANYLEDEIRPIAEACGVRHVLFRSADPQQLVSTVAQALDEPVAAPGETSFDDALVRGQLRTLNAKLVGMVEQLAANEAQLVAQAGELAVANAELAVANAALREVDRVRTEFVHCVSHELRTPLTSIIGYAEMIADAAAAGRLGAGEVHMINRIRRGGDRLLAMVEDLLTLAAVDLGMLPFRQGVVDLRVVVDRLRASLDALLSAPGLTVVVDVAPTIRLIGDGVAVERVLRNLLTNAVRFSPDGGTITVSALQSDAQVLIMVTDTGLGIPAAEQPNVFQRFFRGADGVRRAVHGTGLGLSVVKAIVDGQGGWVTMHSEHGTGTTVTVALPRWSG